MANNHEALATAVGVDVGGILKRLDALERGGQPGGSSAKRNLVYVSKEELLKQNGVAAFSNNTVYSYSYPKPFANKPYLNVQLELNGNFIQYIRDPTNTGFKFATNYGAAIQGLWYEAEEMPQN